MDLLIVIVLCLIGILLILAEIFLIPGVTISIVAGIAASIGGVYYAFTHLGATAGIITLLIMLTVIIASCVYLVKSKTLDSIGLKTDINSTVAGDDELKIAVGDEGIAVSRLNPIGKVQVNGIVIEGKSANDFIDERSEIVVTAVSRNQLIVKLKH
ncbi:MAG: NfeD family protein [Candidatus Symbiothrix sp.]|jgi:membrane-bound ClpP family serine protease|nr:NfeD family protein [Candidatus Symbiothrix sp.]